MSSHNTKAKEINISRIQKGNMELTNFMNEYLLANHEYIVRSEKNIWYNQFILEDEIRPQCPLVSFNVNDKCIFFSDLHEWDGYNGNNNAEGRFKVVTMIPGFDFDENPSVEFETIEELSNFLESK